MTTSMGGASESESDSGSGSGSGAFTGAALLPLAGAFLVTTSLGGASESESDGSSSASSSSSSISPSNSSASPLSSSMSKSKSSMSSPPTCSGNLVSTGVLAAGLAGIPSLPNVSISFVSVGVKPISAMMPRWSVVLTSSSMLRSPSASSSSKAPMPASATSRR